MDDNTQQNAGLVEEASAASEAIVEQASQLASLVDRYRVQEEGSSTPRPVRIDRRGSQRPWSAGKHAGASH
jgi:methyl-accepting chemotaxis protein